MNFIGRGVPPPARRYTAARIVTIAVARTTASVLLPLLKAHTRKMMAAAVPTLEKTMSPSRQLGSEKGAWLNQSITWYASRMQLIMSAMTENTTISRGRETLNLSTTVAL